MSFNSFLLAKWKVNSFVFLLRGQPAESTWVTALWYRISARKLLGVPPFLQRVILLWFICIDYVKLTHNGKKNFLCLMCEIIQKVSIQLNVSGVPSETTCRMKFMVVVTIQVACYYRLTSPKFKSNTISVLMVHQQYFYTWNKYKMSGPVWNTKAVISRIIQTACTSFTP